MLHRLMVGGGRQWLGWVLERCLFLEVAQFWAWINPFVRHAGGGVLLGRIIYMCSGDHLYFLSVSVGYMV